MEIGSKAPEILGVDQNGKEVRLSDYAGKKLVLYFYPKDSTPGCTSEACSLRDNYEELKAKGYEVVGVSVDSEKSHQKFIEKTNCRSLSLPIQIRNLLRNSVYGARRKCVAGHIWVRSARHSSSTRTA